MCNSIHNNSKPIPESGYGYKIFNTKFAVLTPMFGGAVVYRQTNGWIVWLHSLYHGISPYGKELGFCFFRTRCGTERFIKKCIERGHAEYGDCVIRKIQYRRGMGSHVEGSIMNNITFTTSLCKEFKIVMG